ncbi:MAG: sugar phosphate nucleotidyltransferase [Candidatus Acetothermia bacterium]
MDAVILAAGKGTRMVSEKPKVLHYLHGSPLVQHLLDSIGQVSTGKVILVIGYGANLVKEELEGRNLEFVLQEEQKGTAHALEQAREKIDSDRFIVFPGDMPLIEANSIRKFLEKSTKNPSKISLLTVKREDPTGYGRIKRGKDGKIEEIVEEKDASKEEKGIKEVNTGVYLFSNEEFIWSELRSITPENAQNELYLTDLVERTFNQGFKISSFRSSSPEEFLGVNTRKDLAKAGQVINERKLDSLMDGGVTVVDPGKTVVESPVSVKKDTVIRPFTTLRGATQIGKKVDLGPNLEVHDGKIGDGVDISHSVVRNAEVSSGREVPPFKVFGPEDESSTDSS